MSNPVFQGGIGLAILGGGFAALRSLPGRVWNIARGKLMLECVVDNEDSLHFWLLVWLAQQSAIKRAGLLRAVSRFGADGTRRIEITAGSGELTLTYAGVRFWLTLSDERSQMSRERIRSVTLRCRRRHREVLMQLFEEVRSLEYHPDQDHTNIYIPNGHGDWNHHAARPRRPPDSVVLDGDLFERLQRDAEWFIENRQWYTDLGIPYRRGYLLHGPPGNGKSTLTLTLAGVLRRNLYVLSLSDPLLTDNQLVNLLGEAPINSILVLEDADTIFNGRERETENKLTFSGLLNAIDGPLATEGRLLILTTNHIARLDPALIRPGRIDVQLEINNATQSQAERMFKRFFPDADEEAVTAFGTTAAAGTRSMAALQAELIEQFSHA